VPQFRAIGHLDGLGTWMLVDYLPGRPVSWLEPALLGDLLAFSDGLARDEPPPAGRFSWTAEVERRLAPAAGWESVLEGDGVTRPLVEDLERLVAATQPAGRRRSDLVHGDLLATQLLVDVHGALGGILDWDAAGYGERAFDLALLFLNCHVQASRHGRSLDRDVIERLHTAATLSSGASFGYYLAYHVIEMLSFVVRYNPAHVAWRAGLAREILTSLRALGGAG
jgi:Ser/Thr protein kinase RdoA (MazF antagonist)